MTAFLLILSVIFCSINNTLNKQFTIAHKSGRYFFPAVAAFFAMLVFMVTNKGLHKVPLSVLPYCFGMAVAFFTATLFVLLAVKNGSLAKTSLIVSYSLLVPVFYGIFFLKENVSLKLIAGITLLIISLYMTRQKGERTTASFKWLIFVSLAFLGNGFCSTVQKMQTVAFDGKYSGDFMIITLFIVSVAFFLFLFISERDEFVSSAKQGGYLAVLYGICTGLNNFVVIVLNGRAPASVMFPIISGGSTIAVFLISLLIYKERFSRIQYVGFAVGVGSVILLNL